MLYITVPMTMILFAIFAFGLIIHKQIVIDHQQKMFFLVHTLVASIKESSADPAMQAEQFIRKYKNLFPYILDVTFIEHDDAGKRITAQPNGTMDQAAVCENYMHQASLEKELLLKASSTPYGVQKIYDSDATKIIKSYIPITLDGNNTSSIAVITSDYDFIFRNWLVAELRIFEIAVFSLFILSFTILAIVNIKNQRRHESILEMQKTYSQNIQSLFNAIKEYRHDMNHHIYALTGLCELKAYDELEKYLKNLARIHISFNNLIKINIPALRGYIQAKITQATENNIEFEYHFEGLDKIHIDLSKATDLVRIVGNIVDNAFDAVKSNADNHRKVTLIGKLDNHSLVFYIHNNGSPIPKEHLPYIFEQGFTTKKNTGNSGMGLAIVKSLVSKYKGTIEVQSDANGTDFSVRIPLSLNEIMKM